MALKPRARRQSLRWGRVRDPPRTLQRRPGGPERPHVAQAALLLIISIHRAPIRSKNNWPGGPAPPPAAHRKAQNSGLGKELRQRPGSRGGGRGAGGLSLRGADPAPRGLAGIQELSLGQAPGGPGPGERGAGLGGGGKAKIGEVVGQGRGRRPGAGLGQAGWRSGCRAGGGARCPYSLTGCSDLFWVRDPQEVEGALEPAQKGGVHTLDTPRSDPVRAPPPAFWLPGSRRASIWTQAPSGQAGWRRGVGGRTGGLGPSALQARPWAVAWERTAEAARGAPDSSPLSRAAGLHHPRVWLLSRPPPSKNSEPQNQPQTGGAAWGNGPGLGPVGARAGQALPLRAAGGQSAESTAPDPSL